MQFIDDFYIILPSNINAPEFPENRTNNYITPLPYPIELPGEWECGVAEINYCHSWYNVNEGDNEIKYVFKSNEKINNVLELSNLHIIPMNNLC